MKIKLAKSAGFCVGVKRAVELVLRIADEKRSKKIFTHGPLIHNPQTVEMLQEKGIGVIESLSDGNPGDIVVIRSHGVSPDVRQEIVDAGYEIFDATCPKVAYVHKIVKKYSNEGYAVIIVGDSEHAEVVGIKGEASGDVAVVSSPDDVSKLPRWEKVVVVAQTTMDRRTFDEVVSAVLKNFQNAVIKNTLCSETSYRQDEIEELARECDAFVVIGGKNSANTGRLYKLASATGLPTFWVETEKDISPKDFEEIERIAVVAGASTPHWIISRVVEYLETMNKKFLPPWKWNWLKKIAYSMLRSNFFPAVSVGFLTFALAKNFGFSSSVARGLITSAIFFAAQNLYENREWQGLALMDPNKVQFVRQTRKTLLPLSISALAIAVFIALFADVVSVAIAVALASLTILYWKLPIFERLIPSSIKDTMLMVLWIILVFSMGSYVKPLSLIPIAVLGGLRALTMGLKELETDRILQRKSFTAMVGEKLTVIFGAFASMAGIAAIFLSKSMPGMFSSIIIAMWFLLFVVGMRAIRKGTYIEFIADALIFLGAIMLIC
ncbi:4-hydroxy-3-methylbut-2-enyl diphosphate reductase [bacterium]|nr:4-hydroxy-3-methylbut-2-enyl diphosphate reductase [bacterium]